MPIRNTPRQDNVFYGGLFDRAVETQVLSLLAAHHQAGRWIPGDYESQLACLQMVRQQLRNLGIQDISLLDLYRREVNWGERYRNFRRLISQWNVGYDIERNQVLADRETWNAIHRDNPQAMVYYREGEMNWIILNNLYSNEENAAPVEDRPHSTITSVSSIRSETVDQPTRECTSVESYR